jgi:hypothetical protein
LNPPSPAISSIGAIESFDWLSNEFCTDGSPSIVEYALQLKGEVYAKNEAEFFANGEKAESE